MLDIHQISSIYLYTLAKPVGERRYLQPEVVVDFQENDGINDTTRQWYQVYEERNDQIELVHSLVFQIPNKYYLVDAHHSLENDEQHDIGRGDPHDLLRGS